MRTEAEIDKIDGGGDSGSEMAKDLSTLDADVDQDSDLEKQDKPCIKGASKRKARSHKESRDGGELLKMCLVTTMKK